MPGISKWTGENGNRHHEQTLAGLHALNMVEREEHNMLPALQEVQKFSTELQKPLSGHTTFFPEEQQHRLETVMSDAIVSLPSVHAHLQRLEGAPPIITSEEPTHKPAGVFADLLGRFPRDSIDKLQEEDIVPTTLVLLRLTETADGTKDYFETLAPEIKKGLHFETIIRGLNDVTGRIDRLIGKIKERFPKNHPLAPLVEYFGMDREQFQNVHQTLLQAYMQKPTAHIGRFSREYRQANTVDAKEKNILARAEFFHQQGINNLIMAMADFFSQQTEQQNRDRELSLLESDQQHIREAVPMLQNLADSLRQRPGMPITYAHLTLPASEEYKTFAQKPAFPSFREARLFIETNYTHIPLDHISFVFHASNGGMFGPVGETGPIIKLSQSPDSPVSMETFRQIMHEIGHACHFFFGGKQENGILLNRTQSSEGFAFLFQNAAQLDYISRKEKNQERARALSKEVLKQFTLETISWYLTASFETKFHNQETHTKETARRVWEETNREIGIAVPEKQQDAWVNPLFISHPRYYGKYVSAALEIISRSDDLRVFIEEKGMDALVTKMRQSVFTKGWMPFHEQAPLISKALSE
ncbi:MAG TPA: hypothetical protein DCY48_02630 [Candidatus Magasanikbacteria bacterium]|nr:MAG: hypothetical protein A3I74_02900 [Candidatus Magasanikbacteria bacterium RIFCSPLOWO2_02_FULL_47_16]OGH79560.1 MAG: hypothetical protein A3C10_00505 [Candidatus Magasanikbacteria bacterium RIFCSPHIGHO2_02_FULL_48_18]HAZ28648.1 hypothetical protein [Candidatus Magasanikbacteria bacterium]